MDISSLSKKKKNILVIVFIVLGVLAIGGIASVFILNYNTFLPSVPFIVNDGNSTIITTKANENYKGYRFKFSAQDETQIIIESESNILTEKDLKNSELKVGGTYDVSVCYVANDEKENTDYSDSASWTYVKYLNAPVISHNEDEKVISWQAIEGAEKYCIFYREGDLDKSIDSTDTYFNYNNIVAGESEMYVVAISSKSGYKNSTSSNIVTFINKLKLATPESVTLSTSDYKLTVKSAEELSHIKIYVDGEISIAKLSNPIQQGGKFVYTVEIRTIYRDFAQIGVSAYSPNQYYIESDILYLE